MDKIAFIYNALLLDSSASIMREAPPKVNQPVVERGDFHILTQRRARRFPARHLSFFFATWYNGIPLGAKQGFAAPVRR
ncbi:MAG: hypothetical protein ACI4AL_05180 [Aristaeellaceae bacterium]